ncbi:MAG TPA: cation diffusion facilitator family transporter, partial [Oscillospiraceae bacterium]|nr:cation diffusion facilitator family transporter [Oscillospiraceae bacterium]
MVKKILEKTMTCILIKLFVKDYNNLSSPKVRTDYGILSGTVGLIINLLLCLTKFLIGSVTNSISITADAMNNLSDAGSGIISLIAFKLSGKPADREHPYGHGRLEYISAMVVSLIILIAGFEFAKSSFEKILKPSPINYSSTFLVLLVFTILAKLWLALFYRKIGKRINSPSLLAVFFDSLGDAAATSVSLISLLFSAFSDLNVDGYAGLIVSLFVFAAGIRILKETIGPLIGEPPSEELIKKLTERIISYPGVLGIHDLMIHNYGEQRNFGSVHVEVAADEDIIKSHNEIDLIEREIKRDFGIDLVIHLDP